MNKVVILAILAAVTAAALSMSAMAQGYAVGTSGGTYTNTPAPVAPVAADSPPLRRPEICTQQYAPVCGELNGIRKTYSNSCFAAAAGARMVMQGNCQ